jgi:hypothetical protein
MALIVGLVLVMLGIGALLFSDAPVRQIVGEVWRAFWCWWQWPDNRRRTSNVQLPTSNIERNK